MKLNLKQSVKVWFQINVMSLFYFGYSSKDKDSKSNLDNKNQLTFKQQGTINLTQASGATTVIISANSDTETTTALIESLQKQTIKPLAIWVVCQTDEHKSFFDHSSSADVVWVNNSNFLGWDKAALTQLITTEYVVWIESFMKPPKEWLANCINQFETQPGIYGASGTINANKQQSLTTKKIGWDGIALDKNQHVDFVQDAMFFSKALFCKLSMALFSFKDYNCSPEVMLCYLANKELNTNAYVLPYSDKNQKSWSTDKGYSLPLSRREFSFDLFQTKLNAIKNFEEGTSAVIGKLDKLNTGTGHHSFNDELFFFTDKILSHENFSIVRFGDGEMKIVKGESIKTSRFFYTPGDEKHEYNRDILCKSLSYNSPQYFVGFPGRCCVGDEYTDSIINLSGLPEQQLTWASVFINANYDHFLNVTTPALQKRTLNLICFEKAILKHLPFKIKKHFGVGMNAWADDLEKTLPAIEAYIEANNVKDEVFIFCSGILSNMLIYKLTEKYPDNTYLDVGSVFDVYLSLGKTRRYLKGNQKQIQHSCIW
jgi:hypothetical protein